ncbi:hypothetical protein ACUOCP_58675, partial [Escherichia sp. R-CC3]
RCGDVSIWHVRFTDDGDLPFADANIQQPGRQPTFRVICAIVEATDKTWQLMKLTVSMLGKLITGDV